MSTAPRIDHRPQRAAGIVQAGDVHESQPGLWRVRDRAGSGIWHHVTATTCDCRDFNRSGLACKHQLAVCEFQKTTAGPRCPECGSATRPEQYYIGGRGYIWFASCKTNREHRSVKM